MDKHSKSYTIARSPAGDLMATQILYRANVVTFGQQLKGYAIAFGLGLLIGGPAVAVVWFK